MAFTLGALIDSQRVSHVVIVFSPKASLIIQKLPNNCVRDVLLEFASESFRPGDFPGVTCCVLLIHLGTSLAHKTDAKAVVKRSMRGPHAAMAGTTLLEQRNHFDGYNYIYQNDIFLGVISRGEVQRTFFPVSRDE